MMQKELRENLPNLPGIYIFKDLQNQIIYIGKAKSLKKRIASYFNKQNSDWKVQELIKEYEKLDFILTKNETEALLLEAQMIRDYKPKYNVLLKAGNPFLYLLITQIETLPELKLVRTKDEKGTYFGPFLHKKNARSLYYYLLKSFKLFICKTNIESGCLDYHIGKCAGNCKPDFDLEGYKVRLKLAQVALEQKFEKFEKQVLSEVETANQKFEFERSRNLHQYLEDSHAIFETIKTGFNETRYKKAIAIATSDRQDLAEIFADGLIELQKFLKLERTPRSIDCFDISHFQSSYIVGSCVRYFDGKPEKNSFRRFKIKTLTDTQNDYQAIKEIVARRYKDPDNLPDIILIDGGKGQLNAALEIIPDANVISLAKREETVFSKSHPNGFKLDLHQPIGKLLTSIRDYAHHFAISYHRLLRSKGSKTLDLEFSRNSKIL